MNRIRLSVLTAAAFVASCGSTDRPEPEIRVVERLVPTPVSCIPASAQINPQFRVSRSDVQNARDPAERLRLTAAGFLERDAFIGEALPLLRACAD